MDGCGRGSGDRAVLASAGGIVPGDTGMTLGTRGCPRGHGEAAAGGCAPVHVASLTNRASEQVVPKGIIGLHGALFKEKGQAIELCRLIRLS